MQRARKIGIYKIENLINGKVYIGQSVDIEKRINHHFTEAAFNEKNIEYNAPIHQAIRKYGADKFKVDILEECLKIDLDAQEVYWIKYYRSFPPSANKGYNLTAGAKSATSINFLFPKLSDITNDLRDSMLSQSDIADKYDTSLEMIQGINTGRYWYRDEIEYPIRNFYIRKPRPTDRYPEVRRIYYGANNRRNFPKDTVSCPECGAKMHPKSALCAECEKKSRAKKLPNDFIKVVSDLKAKIHIQEHYKIGPLTLERWLDEAHIDLDKIKHPNKKDKKPKVYVGCYESVDAEEPAAIYPSMKAASDACGVRAPSMIKKACLTGELYHGYFWKFI